MYRIIVAGSRSYNDFDRLCTVMDDFIPPNTTVEIVSGGAKGADRLAEEFAHLRHMDLKIFRANWNAYGKRAGIVRNERMGDYADALVAFWNNRSPGTKHMIHYARMKKLKVRVEEFNDE